MTRPLFWAGPSQAAHQLKVLLAMTQWEQRLMRTRSTQGVSGLVRTMVAEGGKSWRLDSTQSGSSENKNHWEAGVREAMWEAAAV